MTEALLLTAWLACQGLDLGTTLHMLQQPQFREANIVIRGKHLPYVKVGVNVGVFIWREKAKREHPKLRWIMPTIMAAGGCAPAAWNLHTLTQAQR